MNLSLLMNTWNVYKMDGKEVYDPFYINPFENQLEKFVFENFDEWGEPSQDFQTQQVGSGFNSKVYALKKSISDTSSWLSISKAVVVIFQNKLA